MGLGSASTVLRWRTRPTHDHWSRGGERSCPLRTTSTPFSRRSPTVQVALVFRTVARAVAGTIAGADLPLSTPVRGPDHRLPHALLRSRWTGVSAGMAALLLTGGVLAGVINAMAGGGSMLTIPLLVAAGVPGNIANGSNRIGVLGANGAAAMSFRRVGVRGMDRAHRVLVPVIGGSVVGSFVVSRVSDAAFERAFAVLLVPLILLSLRPPKASSGRAPWGTSTTAIVFTAIGLYGGAVQAGVGLVLVAALARAGMDLVTANSVKVVIILIVTAVAMPAFILGGQVRWLPACVLAVGFSAGGWVGARIAVRGGERVVRIMMVAAVLALGGQLIGLY